LRAATGAFLAAIIFLPGVLVGAGTPRGGGIAVLQPVQLGTAGGRTAPRWLAVRELQIALRPSQPKQSPTSKRSSAWSSIPGSSGTRALLMPRRTPPSSALSCPIRRNGRISQERPSREETRGQGPQSERVSGTPSEGRSHEHAGLLKTKIVGKIIPVAAFVLDKEGGAGKGRKPPNSQLKLGGGK
jgi:hypothetical protein